MHRHTENQTKQQQNQWVTLWLGSKLQSCTTGMSNLILSLVLELMFGFSLP